MPEDKQARLDILRAWFQERRAAFVQRIGDKNKAQLSTSRDAIEAICKERLLTSERQTDYRYQIAAPFGKIEIEMQPEGIRFATPLGIRSNGGNHLETLRQLVNFNTATTIGKLTIAEDQSIILSVDFPYLDRQAAADAIVFLERAVPDLRSRLDKTI
jgi:hypothetical protein